MTEATVPPDRITSGLWGAERTFDRVTGLKPVSLWEPLQSPDHVRLILLYPPGWPHHNSPQIRHQDDTKIQCRLFQAQLADLSTTGRPKFAALSYTWGSTKKPRQVLCNSTRVQVTENLYHALKWIRHLTRPRLVWNDYLCINQTDSDEKSAQVARMGRIFRQAHVISYIGGSEDPEHARNLGWTWTRRILPSWCPDFGVGGPKGIDPAAWDFSDYWGESSGQNERLPVHAFPVSTKVLSIRGVRCATIAACANHKRSDKNPRDFVVKSGRLALRLLNGKSSNEIYVDFLDALRRGSRSFDPTRWPAHPFLLDAVRHHPFDAATVSPEHYWSTLELFAPYYLEKHAPNLFSLGGTAAPRDMKMFTDQHSAFISEMESNAYDTAEFIRRCFITRSTPPLGVRFGCGSDAVRVGDEIFVAYGEDPPLIVRRIGKEGYYRFVGHCSLNGLMEGEAPHLGLPEEDLLLI